MNISHKKYIAEDEAGSIILDLIGLEFVVPLSYGSLSPSHGTSSGCGWRKRSPDMEGAVNILHKQSQTANKGWTSSLRIGQGANNSSLEKKACYKMLHMALELDASG
jgi:hypothetical protein